MIILLLSLWWAYAHAIVKITVTNPGSGMINYSFSNTNGDERAFASSSPSTSRIIGSGEYTLTISQNNKNYLSIVKPGHWLSHSKVIANLQPEKQRTYVGDNPSKCMFYTSQLYSVDCGSPFSSVVRHVPADSNLPTYIESHTIPGIEGVFEGAVKTNEGNLVLVHLGDVEGPGSHILYLVDNDLSPAKKIVLNGLSNNTDYSIANYKQGWLIYSTDLSQIYYYASVGSTPTKVPVPRPSDKNLSPVSLMTNQGHITVAYSQAPSDLSGKQNVKNEVIDFNSTGTQKIDYIGPPPTKATWCATGRVCVLSGKIMSIYSLADAQQVLRLGSNQDMFVLGDILLLAQDKKILQLDAHNLSGSIDYSYGRYSFCGYQAIDSSRYVLCMQSNNKKVALLIDRSVDDKDSIDKKIQQLSSLKEVGTVSIYGPFIHVSPVSGALVFSAAQKGYIPDPAKQAAARAKINAEINKLGINKNVYSVNITK